MVKPIGLNSKELPMSCSIRNNFARQQVGIVGNRNYKNYMYRILSEK